MLADQVAFLQGAADDAETRAAVSSTPVADREAHAAARDVANHARLLDETRQRITALEHERDELLDRLFDLEDDR